MGERADRYEINAAFTVIPQSVDRYTARRFNLGPAINQLHGLACLFGSEIVEHDSVGLRFESLQDLIGVSHLDLNLEIFAVFLEVLSCTGYGV